MPELKQLTYAGLICLYLTTGNGLTAAEDAQLLTITGNLIDVIKAIDDENDPADVIARYYDELDSEEQKEAVRLQKELSKLIPDYEIAFAAADTAEVNSVLSDITYRWAVLRTFHAEHFTTQAQQVLNKAYNELYLLLD